MSASQGRTVFSVAAWGILLPATLFWAGCAPSMPTRTVTVQQSARTITVVGRGEVTAKPDIARTTAGVEASAKTVGEAMKQATAQMTSVLDALKKLGIADKDLRTSNFSIHFEPPQPSQPEPRPMMAPPPPGRGPAPPAPMPLPEPSRGSYRVSNMVEIIIRDPSKAGTVLETAVNAGANSVWNLSFTLDNTDAVEAEARKKAVADARARAETLAKLQGIPLGAVLTVSEIVGRSPGPPMPMPMMEMSARFGGGPPLEGGELTFSTTLEIVYAVATPAAQAGD